MTARRHALILLTLGALLGVATWVFSPWITGRAEPWDADLPIWLVLWLAVAVAGGLTGRARGTLLPIGYALGQMLVTGRPLLVGDLTALLGWSFIIAYAAVAVLLSFALAALTATLKRLRGASSRDSDADPGASR